MRRISVDPESVTTDIEEGGEDTERAFADVMESVLQLVHDACMMQWKRTSTM